MCGCWVVILGQTWGELGTLSKAALQSILLVTTVDFFVWIFHLELAYFLKRNRVEQRVRIWVCILKKLASLTWIEFFYTWIFICKDQSCSMILYSIPTLRWWIFCIYFIGRSNLIIDSAIFFLVLRLIFPSEFNFILILKVLHRNLRFIHADISIRAQI